MKFKLSTLILLFVALGLGGFVYFFEIRAAPQREEAQAEKQKLFDFTEDQVQAFTVQTKQQTLSFQRSDNRAWQMQAPTQTPANDASVAYLLNLLATGTSVPVGSPKENRTLTAPATQRIEFGLDQPLATVDVKLNNNEVHRLVLGKPNFNRSFLYAQADPPRDPGQDLKVLLVSMDFENAVNRPLLEWQTKDNHSDKKEQK